MANNNTRKQKSPGKTAAEPRDRFQLVWDEETAKKAGELCEREVRSFNNLMAWLVNKEYARLEKEKAA